MNGFESRSAKKLVIQVSRLLSPYDVKSAKCSGEKILDHSDVFQKPPLEFNSQMEERTSGRVFFLSSTTITYRHFCKKIYRFIQKALLVFSYVLPHSF